VSVHVAATIRGMYAARADAQKFTMQCVRAMYACAGKSNVQVFRVRQGGFPEPQPVLVEMGNEKGQFRAFDVTLQCELVFSTGGTG